MKKVDLGFKARDLHELACHFIAMHAGLYRERGLDVTLQDTRLVPDDELPDSFFSAACGSALLRWLHGAKVRVLLVAAARPMFWLYSTPDIETVGDLRGRAIATYPAPAPPANFLRIALEDAGLIPDRDVALAAAPDDAARLEKLRAGSAAAALLSSAVMPERVEQFGYRGLCCLGDSIQVPTTGLAVGRAMLEREPDTAAAMRDAFSAALCILHEDTALACNALAESDLVDRQDSDRAVRMLRRFYTSDGRVAAGDVLPGVQRLARLMSLPAPVEVESLYDCLRIA